MATIAENLQILKDSTDAIKLAIIDKGGNISGDISTWAEAIEGISGDNSSSDVIDVYWSVLDLKEFNVSFVAPNDGRIIIAYYADGEGASYAFANAGENDLTISTNLASPDPFIEAAMFYAESSGKTFLCKLIPQ